MATKSINSLIMDAIRGFLHLDASVITGQLDAVETSQEFTVGPNGALLSLQFDGSVTATIHVERQVDGTNWESIKSYTDSEEINVVGGPSTSYRLNATSLSGGAVDWAFKG